MAEGRLRVLLQHVGVNPNPNPETTVTVFYLSSMTGTRYFPLVLVPAGFISSLFIMLI